MLPRALTLTVVALLCFSPATRAQSPPAGGSGSQPPAMLQAHRTGAFDAVLPIRSPESEAGRWAGRFGFPGDLARWDYDLADESVSVYVPAAYDPAGEPYGVVVWLSPSDDGAIPARLRPLFDDRRLIWIGPNEAGNQRHLFVRAGLALDAALNAERSYHVDPDRIFVAGLSGGGRVAAMEAVAYPDVFDGGLPIIGVTTYLDVPLGTDPGRSVLRFPAPSEEVLERARGQPLVIMTGSEDFNREECRLTAAAYERDAYTDVHLLDIEGMGHEMPSVEDFALGLDLLLAPRAPPRHDPAAGRPRALRRPEPGGPQRGPRTGRTVHQGAVGPARRRMR